MEEPEHHRNNYFEDAFTIVSERVVAAFYAFHRKSFPVLDFEAYKNTNRQLLKDGLKETLADDSNENFAIFHDAMKTFM